MTETTHIIDRLIGFTEADIEREVESLLFVDNEDSFPMSRYQELQPVVHELTALIRHHAERAAQKSTDKLTYIMAKELREEMTDILYKVKGDYNA